MKADQWILITKQHAMQVFHLILYLQHHQHHHQQQQKAAHSQVKENLSHSHEEEIILDTVATDTILFQQLTMEDIKCSSIFKLFEASKLVSDEMFFPTIFALLNILPTEVHLQRTTYADWKNQTRSPKEFLPAIFTQYPPKKATKSMVTVTHTSNSEKGTNHEQFKEDFSIDEHAQIFHGIQSFQSAQQEHTFFFRKIKWKYLLLSPLLLQEPHHDHNRNNHNNNNNQQSHRHRIGSNTHIIEQEKELQYLQTWWTIIHCHNERLLTNLPLTAVRVWCNTCIPIIEEVLPQIKELSIAREWKANMTDGKEVGSILDYHKKEEEVKEINVSLITTNKKEEEEEEEEEVQEEKMISQGQEENNSITISDDIIIRYEGEDEEDEHDSKRRKLENET
jgi:hypothetical protein